MFYYKLFKDSAEDEHAWLRPASLALMVYGIFIFVFW